MNTLELKMILLKNQHFYFNMIVLVKTTVLLFSSFHKVIAAARSLDNMMELLKYLTYYQGSTRSDTKCSIQICYVLF